jgi:hypothetical protein
VGTSTATGFVVVVVVVVVVVAKEAAALDRSISNTRMSVCVL